MSLYVRAYPDYSYEVIFVDKGMLGGVFGTNRLHILINPGKYVKLPGQQKNEKDIEINIESLTHIVSMQTSVQNPEMIKRTIYLAERTNKPIITNEVTASYFKENGLSVRQLRILGFDNEVVEGLHIDPIYFDELSEIDNSEEKHPKPKSLGDYGKNLVRSLNPLNWGPIKSVTGKLTNTEKKEIDPTNPLAFSLHLGNKRDLLLPVDNRGISKINQIIPQVDSNYIVIPNKDLSFAKELPRGGNHVIILNEAAEGDQLLTVPKSHNPQLLHNLKYGSLEEWVELT